MTRAKETRPTVRIVQSAEGLMVAEIGAATLTLRPYRTRKGGPSEASVGWGAIYLRAMLARVEEQRRTRRRAGARS